MLIVILLLIALTFGLCGAYVLVVEGRWEGGMSIFFVISLVACVIAAALARLRRRGQIRPAPADPRLDFARSPKEMIAQTREIAGPAPRDIAYFKGLRQPMPSWLRSRFRDPLRQIYKMEKTLLPDGQIVWAHIVQANQQMFRPGDVDCPGVVIYSTDSHFDAHPEELEYVARQLYGIKGRRTEPELQTFADILQNERSRGMRLVIPPSLAGDREVIYTDVMVRRKDLPMGRLSASFLPLLVLPGSTPATLIVPWEWWSPALVALWRE